MAKQQKQPQTTPAAAKKTTKLELTSTLSVLVAPSQKEDAAGIKSYVQKVWNLVPNAEIIVVGKGLDEAQIAELKQQHSEGILVQTAEGTTVQAAVAMAGGAHILVVDDLLISPRNLATWLEEENNTLPEDSIWAGSRYHEKAQLGEDYKMGLWSWLLNMLTRLLTGIVVRDVQAGFRLYPADLAKALFANIVRKDKNYGVEVLHQAKLYEMDVVEKPISISGEAPAISAGMAIKTGLGAWGESLWTWFKHYFITPRKDAQSAYFNKKESPWFRFAFAMTAVFLFVLMPYLSGDYGMTADEFVQNEYGNMLLEYYKTDGKNFDALFYKDLYNYGGLFDYWAAWCNANLGWFEDPYQMRHLLNSLFGAFMMLFVGLVGRVVTGTWMGGLFALLFAALSPRIFGDSMNNPKDIPFAAAYIFTIYHALRFTQQLPKPTLRTTLAVVIGIAAAINIRIGGLLLIAYVAAFSGITFLWKAELRSKLLNIPLMVKMFAIGGFVAVAGLWAGSLYWPYAALDWMKNPFVVLDRMSNYYVGIRVLFDSQTLWSDKVPWNYIPNWMLYTTPLFVLIGLFVSPIMGFVRRQDGKGLPLVLVAFAGFFPIGYVIYQKSGLYDAMRHMIFAYTLFVVLAAWTWSALIRSFEAKAIKWVIAAVMVVLMALPTMFMVRNHPYQYTYFNELIGGSKGAFTKYESDYWMVSMKPLTTWFEENIAAKNRQDTFVVATNCIYPVQHYLEKLGKKNIRVVYVRFHDREKTPWDYGIFYSRFIDREFLVSGIWPPDELVYAEKVDEVPVGVIVKRKSSTKAEAGIAMAKKDWATAAALFEDITKQNPKNESALLLLAQIYSQTGQWPELKAVLDKASLLSNVYSNTLGMYGVYYMGVNNMPEAKKAFQKAVENNYKYTFGNFHLARMYAQENNFEEAMKCLELFDAYGGQPAQGYDLAIQISEQTKNDLHRYFFTAKKMSMNQDWANAMKMLNSALAIDPTYEPALKMQRNYNDAVEQNTLKNALTEAAKRM